jgi:hypothetical protein
MRPTEEARKYVISRHVEPARSRGEKTIRFKVGSVQKELGWTNRTPSVFSTLSSREFLKQAGLELAEKRGGPPSGGPSTTVEFVYRILPEGGMAAESAKTAKPRGGLLALFGICRKMYREVGGGEAFIRQLREDFGSVVPDDEGKKKPSRGRVA